MTKIEKLRHCHGCYCDDYNHGLGGAHECWSLESMGRLILRRRVGINETPPWKRKPELLPKCYRQTGYIFVGKEEER